MGEAYVYLMTNDRHTVLYTGSTNNLRKRVYLHRKRLVPGFTRKYNAHKLVYFESQPDMDAARIREQQIKGLNRDKKNTLVNAMNDGWHDLYSALGRESEL